MVAIYKLGVSHPDLFLFICVMSTAEKRVLSDHLLKSSYELVLQTLSSSLISSVRITILTHANLSLWSKPSLVTLLSSFHWGRKAGIRQWGVVKAERVLGACLCNKHGIWVCWNLMNKSVSCSLGGTGKVWKLGTAWRKQTEVRASHGSPYPVLIILAEQLIFLRRSLRTWVSTAYKWSTRELCISIQCENLYKLS